MRGGIDPGDHRFVPESSELKVYGGFLIRGWEPILPRVRCFIHEHSISDRLVGRGFHTVRGGVDLGELRFRPRVVVVHAWKDF